MEREINILKEKVLELSQENLALREINVQFQLDNFKLQQKIKKLESSLEIALREDEPEQNESDDDESDPTYDPNAEYIVEEDIASPPRKFRALQLPENSERSVISDDELVERKPIKAEHSIADEQQEFDFNASDPAEATKIIFAIAEKRGTLDKIKNITGGQHKDSAFVNKILDLVFDRETLASSSVCGQKCQSKQSLPAKPALDQTRLNLCRQAFLYRLKRTSLSSSLREERLKRFNSCVNFKVQNARKLINKKEH